MAKQALKKCSSSRAKSAPSPAPVEEEPTQAPARKPSKDAASKRRARDAKPATATRRKLAVAAAILPKDLGATAAGRHKAFQKAKKER